MKRLFLAVALIAAAAVSLRAQTQAQIDTVLKAFCNRNRILGTEFAIVKNGELAYVGSYGVKDTLGTPFTGDEIYPLASVSKSFTATAIMTLVDKGLVNLDEDAGKYLPISLRNPAFPDSVITVRMLLNHTSSIIDAGGGINIGLSYLNPAENDEWNKHYADYAPGHGYKYSNLCYNILGIVVERVSGIRFDRYVRQQILEPLGIEASFNVEDLDSTRFTHVPVWNTKSHKFTRRYNRFLHTDFNSYKIGRDGDRFYGSWAMRTDIRNLAKWMLFHMGRGQLDGVRVLSEASAIEMQTGTVIGEDHKKNLLEPTTRKYALGLYETTYWIPGERVCGHSGHIIGIRTSMFFNAEEKWGICTISPLYKDNDGYALITDYNRTLHGLFIGFN